MIYIYGDSHSNFFTKTHPSRGGGACDIFRSQNMGAGTAHNFHTNHLPTLLENVQPLPPKSPIVIVAGEIDCRLHIPKLFLERIGTLEALVEATVQHLTICYTAIQKAGHTPIAWGPHPTRHLETLDYKTEWYCGTQNIRNTACMLFNDMLSQQGFPFETLFYEVDDSRAVHDKYYLDPLHLNEILWPIAKSKLEKYNV